MKSVAFRRERPKCQKILPEGQLTTEKPPSQVHRPWKRVSGYFAALPWLSANKKCDLTSNETKNQKTIISGAAPGNRIEAEFCLPAILLSIVSLWLETQQSLSKPVLPFCGFRPRARPRARHPDMTTKMRRRLARSSRISSVCINKTG